ncbi:unnamed protein product [Citrullus colocynthis]|uniref:Uncharacterized protein n=1 Tax=Citrullus colocynthis TaxID=252529 RepID=A0ABP0XTP2_9ROSI
MKIIVSVHKILVYQVFFLFIIIMNKPVTVPPPFTKILGFNLAILSLSDRQMPFRTFIEVEPPSPLRYIIGAVIMMIGVVLPLGYMLFRNKRGPSSSSSYSKQT